MKVFKTRDVKTPNRGTPQSAGIDFFIPNDFQEVTIRNLERILIPSGLIVDVPTGYMFLGLNKSGVAVKQGLIVGAQVVDEDYTKEMHLHVINVSGGDIVLKPGEKLIQFVLVPVFYDEVQLVDTLEECLGSKLETSERTGGFGSTGLT
jgi:dUTP pyrophosphatase